MNTTNRTLTYTIIFIAAGILSFGITFGALSVFTKEDNINQQESDISDVEQNEEPAENPEPEEPGQDDWRTEAFTLNESTSLNLRLPEGWIIEDSATTADDSTSKLIKSPAVIGEDQNPTDIHFCLAFKNLTVPSGEDQAVINAPTTINTEIQMLQSTFTAQVKISEQAPDRPFLFISSSPSDAPSSTLITLPDQTFLMVSGAYGCEDNTEAASTHPTAEVFNSQPEVRTALEILSSASLVNQNQNNQTPDADNQDTTNPDAAVSAPVNPAAITPQEIQ